MQSECPSPNSSHVTIFNTELHAPCPVTLEMRSRSLTYCTCLTLIPRSVPMQFQSNWLSIYRDKDFFRFGQKINQKNHKKSKNHWTMTICTNLVETHPRHIPAKFEVNLANGFREEVKNVTEHCKPY